VATAKKTVKKQQKILSQAAQKRLEKERLEAQKTKTQKLAESLKRRSTVLAKHDSVVKNLDEVKAAAKHTVTTTLKPVKKIKQKSPMNRESAFDLWKDKNAETLSTVHKLFKQAVTIQKRVSEMERREAVKLREALRDCYGIYQATQALPDPDAVYGTIKSIFKKTDVKVQSNTPDETLLVRFIFNGKSNKQVSEYATVIRYAYETKISANGFIEWYQKTTQTRILQKAREAGTSDYKARLARARVLLMKYFDILEQWPLGKFEYPSMLASKRVHLPDDLIFVICRGTEIFNRDTYFDPDQPSRTQVPLASISALYFIPNNIDISNLLTDRIAKLLESHLEFYEQQAQEQIEKVWVDDLTNFLQERELGAAYRSADRWADRIQASIAEDQVTFEKKRKKIQKLRDASRK